MIRAHRYARLAAVAPRRARISTLDRTAHPCKTKHPRALATRPASIGMPGRHQSESVADIASERPAEIVGIRNHDVEIPGGGGRAALRQAVEEIGDGDVDRVRGAPQRRGAQPIRAALVLLYLLEGQAEPLSQHGLAHAERDAAFAQARPDVDVNRIGPVSVGAPPAATPGMTG